jgi:cytosine/adenosine deaminase-related metal-dependent hydrolase
MAQAPKSGPHVDDCACCSGVSRRAFLGSAAASAVAGTGVVEAIAGKAEAQSAAAPQQAAGRPMLLKGGMVVTMDPAIGDFERADVLIDGGKIRAVQPTIAAANAEVIDAANTIVMPGFVDTHHHLWQGILRNIGPDMTLADYMRDVNNLAGSVFRPEDMHASNLVSALGTLAAGTTCVLDWSQAQNSPEHSDAAIAGLMESGARAVFGYGYPTRGTAKFWEDPGNQYPADMRRIAKRYFSSRDQRVTLAMAALVFPTEQAVECWKMARELGTRISVHIGSAPGQVEPLAKMGLLANDTTYIHVRRTSDEEWKYIVDSGGSISIAPYVEMIMGHGTPVIQKTLDHGLRPSLSVDVETTVPGDMFTMMRTALSLQRELAFQRMRANEPNVPKLLTARDVLEFATIEGARANGLDKTCGSLTPGKDADVIMLRTDHFNVMPINNAVGAVVQNMDTSNVDTVFVAGKVVKRHGRMVGVDTARIQRMVDRARDHVLASAKLSTKKV